eukprot:824209-Heterocapsa_arctica.AAC.1
MHAARSGLRNYVARSAKGGTVATMRVQSMPPSVASSMLPRRLDRSLLQLPMDSTWPAQRQMPRRASRIW